MRARLSGSGTPVVLIHGWAASGRILEGVAAELDRDYHTHTLDLSGHGGGIEGRVDLGLEELIAETVQYVRALPEPPVLIGWAMGALIALKVAITVPTNALVCVATACGGTEFGGSLEALASRMARDWPRYVRSSVDAITEGRVSPETHRFLCDVMLQTPLTLARRTLLDVATHDATEWATSVDCPALYVHGSTDKISSVEIGRRLAELTPQGRLLEYDGVGHAPFLEQHKQFLGDLREFLGGIEEGAHTERTPDE